MRWRLAIWADEDLEQFVGTYLEREEDGELHKLNLPHPGYYESMASRLYFFDGQAVVPDYSMVVSYTRGGRAIG